MSYSFDSLDPSMPVASSSALEDTTFSALHEMREPHRIGIMGGTFDPIHFGHLNCAERVREALGLDRVIFIPAGDPAFKQGRDIADSCDRYEMCSLAIADNPAFEMSDLEISRSGITYTVDTLEEIRDRLSGETELFFIIGSDSLHSLHEWKDPAKLAMLARFACVVRPGSGIDASSISELEAKGFRIDVVDAPSLDISSSTIRELCADGLSIRYLIPLSVKRYITEHGLYGSSAIE